MNVPTITMDPEQAGDRADEYETKGRTEEDAAIANGYRELEKGRGLISLRTVFADVERDSIGRPRLAIARADRQQVHYNPSGTVDFFSTDYRSHRGPSPTNAFISIARPSLDVHYTSVGYALVPLVPPAIRARHRLAKHFVLWEVEQWAATELGALPDRDPFLLKRVDDDLYAIVAEWDLTPLEQTVLARRIFR